MTMQYIRDTYKVPAKRGGLVEIYYCISGYKEKDSSNRWKLAFEGRISSASNYIHVNGIPFHPTYGVVYLDNDRNILLDTRD